MERGTSWSWALLVIWACSDKAAPVPAATNPPPAAPPLPAATAPASPPRAPNPCDNPSPVTLELQAGVTQQTPWDLEFKYFVDDDKKLGSGYMFQLRSGERRWETRRDNRNWTSSLAWRGFCWRGAERPGRKALRLQIQVAPVCKDGKLQELGGCGNALGPS